MDVQRHWQIQPEEVLRQGPVVPVMVIHKLEQAVPLARALVAGGIRVLEITLRTPVAMEAIRIISREVSGAMVGAGTVTRGEELAAVAEAGAVFAISPGLTVELLDAANQGPIPLIPGIATISELMTGMARGYSSLQIFPGRGRGRRENGPGHCRTLSPDHLLPHGRHYPGQLPGLPRPEECRLHRRLVGRPARGDGPGGLDADYRARPGSCREIGALRDCRYRGRYRASVSNGGLCELLSMGRITYRYRRYR